MSKKEIVIDQEAKKQLEILSSLFCLEDLASNNGNYGVVEKQVTEGGSVQELRIVDFRVSVFTADFENHLRFFISGKHCVEAKDFGVRRKDS